MKTEWDPRKEGRRVMYDFAKKEGGSYSGTQLFLKWSTYTPKVTRDLRNKFEIINWKMSTGGIHYPVWQFTQEGLVEKPIQDILRIFQSDDCWRVMGYFLQPQKSLEHKTPLQLIREGRGELVIRHATEHNGENNW